MKFNIQMKHYYIAYFLFLFLAFVIVKATIRSEPISVNDPTIDEKEVQETKPVRALLSIEAPNYRQQYVLRAFNTDSVEDFLEQLRV